MSQRITMTLPDLVAAALAVKGARYDLDGGEWLKQKIVASMMGDNTPLALHDVGQAAEARMAEATGVLAGPEAESAAGHELPLESQ